MSARRILEGGWTCGVTFWPFLSSSGWWWLISSVFLTRTSCCKTIHADGYMVRWCLAVSIIVGGFHHCGRFPSLWAVSVIVLPLTVILAKWITCWNQTVRDTWLFLAPWRTSFLFHGIKFSQAARLMPPQWKNFFVSLNINFQFCELRFVFPKAHFPVSSLLLHYTVKKFTWALKGHSKFVPKTYLTNLSLDKDQMPPDLQPENYTFWKRHNSKDYHQPGQSVMEKG